MKKKNKKSDGQDHPLKKKAATPLLSSRLLSHLNSKPQHRFTAKQLAKALKISSHKDKIELEAVLDLLTKKGSIECLHGRVYRSKLKLEQVEGVVDHVNAGYAYIVLDGQDDIRVSTPNLKGAFDGDTVRVMIHKGGRASRPEGEVVEIVKRKTDEFVGTIEISPRFAFVVPNNRKVYTDIFVFPENIKKAKDGDKVIVKVAEWPNKSDKNPTGKVVKVLGKSGENETEIHSIMFEYGLPFEFPKEVEQAAEQIPEEIPAAEIKKRRDFRGITTFTIDPLNAKDFDDALSVRQLENGEWEIGVHIADVSHYVTPGTILEKEGFNRATSVYLVDRTVPMLPEKLSNVLCSLRPNEDKLTFSAVFTLTDRGKVTSEWFGRTIIHSQKRFTYEEAQEVMDKQEGPYVTELLRLNDLAKKLREKRFKAGAISFESVEYYFDLDPQGKPLGVYPKVRKDAHKLIEEFMLLANKKVAEFVHEQRKGRKRNSMVYRVHEDPSPEKVLQLQMFVKRFGYTIKSEGKELANSLNRMAEQVEGRPEQSVVTYQAIRTMSKAKYTMEPLGHYGLGFKHYTHFTSPIRRYPDVMAHRLLQHYLDGGEPVEIAEYEERCKHSSDREKRAADAERASIKFKQVEYMRRFLGRELEGMITGATEWGLYVEMDDTRCEGMVRMADMQDDFYVYDEANLCITGKQHKQTYRIGDRVKVRVKATNLEKRTVDLVIV